MFNFDMTKAPIKIGHHDAERLAVMQQSVQLITALAVLALRHNRDERVVDNCARMVKALYMAMRDQTWASAEFSEWWLEQHSPKIADQFEALLRAGDAEAFARYGQSLAMRYPLPRFEVEGRA